MANEKKRGRRGGGIGLSPAESRLPGEEAPRQPRITGGDPSGGRKRGKVDEFSLGWRWGGGGLGGKRDQIFIQQPLCMQKQGEAQLYSN